MPFHLPVFRGKTEGLHTVLFHDFFLQVMYVHMLATYVLVAGTTNFQKEFCPSYEATVKIVLRE